MCVEPILEYFSGIWGADTFDDLHKIYKCACSFYHGVPRNTNIAGLTGLPGWYPPLIKNFINMCRYDNRLICMNNNRLTKIIFIEEIGHEKQGWYHNFSKVCSLVGILLPTSLDQTVDMKLFMKQCKLYYESIWKSEIAKQNKLNVYRQLIHSYGHEEFFKCILQKDQRSLLCQLLCGNLKLEIETGRYNHHTPKSDHICKLCDLNAIEDCYHFILDCSVLTLPHTLLINNVKSVSGDFINLSEIRLHTYCIM